MFQYCKVDVAVKKICHVVGIALSYRNSLEFLCHTYCRKFFLHYPYSHGSIYTNSIREHPYLQRAMRDKGLTSGQGLRGKSLICSLLRSLARNLSSGINFFRVVHLELCSIFNWDLASERWDWFPKNSWGAQKLTRTPEFFFSVLPVSVTLSSCIVQWW